MAILFKNFAFKDVDLGSLVLGDYGYTEKVLTDAEKRIQEAEAKAREERRRLRSLPGQAAVRLWTNVLDSLNIAHPDPYVRITPRVSWRDYDSESVRVYFNLDNLRDTSDPDRKFYGFGHYGLPEYWPGFEPACVYISALWGLYLQHEAFELVTYKGHLKTYEYKGVEVVSKSGTGAQVKKPVIDAHSDFGKHQRLLVGSIKEVLDWAVGDVVAEDLLNQNMLRSRADIKHEIAFLNDEYAREV